MARYTVVDAKSSRIALNIRELLDYRDLFFTLAYRDYRVRYAQTVLGLLWAVLQPMATLLVYVLVFGKALGVTAGDVPYPVFVICGISAWTYFSYVATQAGNSIISAQGMVQKIYFPRLIIPLSKSIVGLIDYGIMLIFIAVLMFVYGVVPSPTIVFLPIFIVFTMLTSLGVGIWLSALTIRFRDFQYVVPFMIQFGLYATPIAYPVTYLQGKLPDWAWILYHLNPMVGIAEGYQWALLGLPYFGLFGWLSCGVGILLFITSLFYFKSVETTMADLV